MDLVDVEGFRIGYVRLGRGPSLVLLHGYVGDGPTTWRHQLEALGSDFDVVAWDAPGAGASFDPSETWGMAGYANCLAGFVRALGLIHPHVVGLSFGGALAVELARRHPDVAATLTLVSAYAGWAGSLSAEETVGRLEQALRLSRLEPDAFVETLLPTMFAAGTGPEDVAAFGEAMRGFHPAGFRAMARASAEDLRDALPTINVPSLLIYGDQDVRAPLPVAEQLHAAIPQSMLKVLPGAGHLCNIECPALFNQILGDFLRATQR